MSEIFKINKENYIKFQNRRCFKNEEELEELGFGLEGTVYKLNDELAIKIYHSNPEKRYIGESMIKKLSTIKTRRIVLPKKEIKNIKEKTRGYIMKYIDGSKMNISDYEKERFIEELSFIEDDIDLLSKRNIRIDDLREENTIITEEGIYLIDSGEFTQEKDNQTELNYYTFNSFLLDDILLTPIITISDNIDKSLELINYLRTRYLHKISVKSTLTEEMKKHETVKQYVKRMTK